MSTRDEIERSVDHVIDAASTEGRLFPFRKTLPSEHNDAVLSVADARDSLLALVRPPAPGGVRLVLSDKLLTDLADAALEGISGPDWDFDYRDAKSALKAALDAAAGQEAGE